VALLGRGVRVVGEVPVEEPSDVLGGDQIDIGVIEEGVKLLDSPQIRLDRLGSFSLYPEV
jgi:hypothetical protein